MKFAKHFVAGMAMVVVLTTIANAQEKVVAEPGRAAYRAKQILGSTVNIEGNTQVGKVDDIVLDDHGNVDYLIVVNEDNRLVTVPWDAAQFNPQKRVAFVPIAPARYKTVPTYTAEQYPVYSAPAYRTQVYQYYGLTPGQERRMIRRGVIAP